MSNEQEPKSKPPVDRRVFMRGGRIFCSEAVFDELVQKAALAPETVGTPAIGEMVFVRCTTDALDAIERGENDAGLTKSA